MIFTIKKSATILLIIFFNIISYAQENYLLTINNTNYSIQLNDTLNIQNKGETLSITLVLKDTLQYSNNYYKLKYPKEYGISESQIDVGVDQIMIMSGDGNGIMIQNYQGMNPNMLQEFMLSELSKESIAYGYKSERNDYKRKLASGQEIDVLKSTLTYLNEITEIEVASIGKKDEGLLIITMNQGLQEILQSHNIKDLMWESFKYK